MKVGSGEGRVEAQGLEQKLTSRKRMVRIDGYRAELRSVSDGQRQVEVSLGVGWIPAQSLEQNLTFTEKASII